jgi:hypothetical protein
MVMMLVVVAVEVRLLTLAEQVVLEVVVMEERTVLRHKTVYLIQVAVAVVRVVHKQLLVQAVQVL